MIAIAAAIPEIFGYVYEHRNEQWAQTTQIALNKLMDTITQALISTPINTNTPQVSNIQMEDLNPRNSNF